ncbi:hypothetical protein ABFV83_09670 [Lacrimispora sp. BS-2]|uniref:Uncharacterized protein n=1 Tax=Lacrimispora sp. BS-2 TaxID=3151850 RepID=A0AAU7PUR6_9FIRM
MKLLSLCEIIFQCALFALIIFHVFKREFKLMKSVILVFVLSFLPELLNALFRIRVDAFSIFVYFIIIFMALYLGSSFLFYDKYKWWDRAIHFLSGIGFAGFGIAIAGTNSGIMKLVVLLLGFTFPITLHVIWEVLEYLSDCITHGNAQRWQKINASNNHVSEKAIQPAGLVDTMNDAICCIAGSGLAVLIWWFVI